MSLAPCSGCQRHVRTSERACPFCGASIEASIASKVVPGITQRMSRAAVLAFTATMGLAACSQEIAAPVYGAPVDAPADTATDNAAPTDNATPSDSAMSDAPVDNGGPAPAYGAPFDAGTPPDDNGGPAPLYGAVPRPDADVQDDAPDASRDGSIGVRYGAVPPPDAGA
jgi:hypothetical protein